MTDNSLTLESVRDILPRKKPLKRTILLQICIQYRRPCQGSGPNLINPGTRRWTTKVSQADKYCLQYHRVHSKENTHRTMESVLSKFNSHFAERDLDSITSDEILSFLNIVTDGTKQSTKRTRYSCLMSFSNLIKNTVYPKLGNACTTPMLRKLFQRAKFPPWTILEKKTVDC